MNREIKTIIEGSGHGLLGTLVWFGQYHAKVRPWKLRDAAQDAGLPSKYVPDHPGAAVAFQRALRDAVIGQEGIRAEVILKTMEEHVCSVMERQVMRGSREASYVQVGRCMLDLKAEVVRIDDDHEVCKAAVKAFPGRRDYLATDDIRTMVQAVLKACGSVSMTSAMQGGHANSRFVPPYGTALLDQLMKTLDAVPGAAVFAIKVPDEPISRESIQRIARSDLMTEVKAAQTEVDRLVTMYDKAAREETAGPRPDILQRRLEEFKQTEEKVGLLADLLSMRVEDLTGGLASAKITLQRMLGTES